MKLIKKIVVEAKEKRFLCRIMLKNGKVLFGNIVDYDFDEPITSGVLIENDKHKHSNVFVQMDEISEIHIQKESK